MTTTNPTSAAPENSVPVFTIRPTPAPSLLAIAERKATKKVHEVVAEFTACGVAKHKTPEDLEFVAEFPSSLSGKIRKVELRDRLAR